jgi:hypothetical protein
VREQVLALGKEMNSPEFKNRYGSFMSSYNSEVTAQTPRTALQEFSVVMMDLGAHVLPSDFKGILEGIHGILPAANGADKWKVGTRAMVGALVGGFAGSIIPGVGTIGGAAAGGLLGGTAGILESMPSKNLDDDATALVRALRENGAMMPGGSPVMPAKPAPRIQLNLNVDGKALAQAVSDQQASDSRYETSAPAYDPSSFYGP